MDEEEVFPRVALMSVLPRIARPPIAFESMGERSGHPGSAEYITSESSAAELLG